MSSILCLLKAKIAKKRLMKIHTTRFCSISRWQSSRREEYPYLSGCGGCRLGEGARRYVCGRKCGRSKHQADQALSVQWELLRAQKDRLTGWVWGGFWTWGWIGECEGVVFWGKMGPWETGEQEDWSTKRHNGRRGLLQGDTGKGQFSSRKRMWRKGRLPTRRKLTGNLKKSLREGAVCKRCKPKRGLGQMPSGSLMG